MKRRDVLKGTAAVAVSASAASIAAMAAPDPILVLYDQWKAVVAEATRLGQVRSVAEEAMDGGAIPKIEYGRYRDLLDGPGEWQPLYAYTPERIDEVTPLGQDFNGETGRERRVRLKAALAEEDARWHAERQRRGITALCDAEDAACDLEDAIVTKILATPARAPLGLLVKLWVGFGALAMEPDPSDTGVDGELRAISAVMRDLAEWSGWRPQPL